MDIIYIHHLVSACNFAIEVKLLAILYFPPYNSL
jgi:hypothetical protein